MGIELVFIDLRKPNINKVIGFNHPLPLFNFELANSSRFKAI